MSTASCVKSSATVRHLRRRPLASASLTKLFRCDWQLAAQCGPRPVAGPHPCRSPAVRGSDYSRRAPTKSRQLARPAFGFEARDRIATLTSEAGSVDGATHLCNAGTAQWIRWMLARFGRPGAVAHTRRRTDDTKKAGRLRDRPFVCVCVLAGLLRGGSGRLAGLHHAVAGGLEWIAFVPVRPAVAGGQFAADAV